MLGHAPLLATIAAALVVAFALGYVAQRLRLSPIVGYLVAGVVIGPFTPGIVADASIGRELSEIGVVLLMFGVGMHFSVKDLFAVRRAAIPGAIGQSFVATIAGSALGLWLGWHPSEAILFGLCLSVASTVVMLRALEDRQLLDTRAGHISVGWLIVEDIFTVVALVAIPVVAVGHGGIGELSSALGWTVLKVSAFAAIMLIVGRKVIPWILARVADTGSRELFTLTTLALGLGIAVGAGWLFDVSFALGAFFAGMVLKESPLSHRAADESLSLRDTFAVLFFVAVGMLVNPATFVEHPLAVLGTLAVIVVGKFAIAFVMMRVLKYSKSMALVVAAALAQIGEFSFILSTLGLSLGLISEETNELILAAAMLSILMNPALFAWASRAYVAKQADAAPHPEPADAPVAYEGTGHAIVVGHGRVGKRAAAALRAKGVDVVVIDDNEKHVTELREQSLPAILGNAVRGKVLRAAGMERATALIVATPDPLTAGVIIEKARGIQPAALILARGHGDADVAYLTERGADRVIVGVYEVADIMVEETLRKHA